MPGSHGQFARPDLSNSVLTSGLTGQHSGGEIPSPGSQSMEISMPDVKNPLTGACRLTIVLGLCTLALVGCGKKEQGASGSGQVVAHVGDEVITNQEFENELRLANVPPNRQKDPAVVKQILGELVLRKYLLQQALSAKLDREPGVLLDLLRARTQVLATAYVARTVSAKPITQVDVDNYIAANPLKFANRQVLATEQIVFPIGSGSQAIIDDNKDAKSLDEVDQRLTIMGVPHNRAVGALDSGEIPEEFFRNIEEKKADAVFFVRSGPNGVFFIVKGEELRPLQGEAAANAARQFIRADRFKAETGIASVSANLEARYEGEYATIMGPASGASAGARN
jgi:EpsD family peptidyl-prolyl cis-trans isomerase